MAATPAFASTPRLGVGVVSTANTARDGTGTIVDILTGVAAGTRVERLVVQATENPADCLVHVFLHDGSTSYLFDTFDMGDPAAASTVLGPFREERRYFDLVMPSSSWKVRASITVAPTAGVVNVFAFAVDLT